MQRANGDRLRTSLLEMAKIGATPGGGVTRVALSEEDRRARDLFAGWLRDTGLAVRCDDLGNVYGRLEGVDPLAAPVMMGSHLDSVPGGGRYDGAFGVLTALEVARTLVSAGLRPVRPVEVVAWTNEEGARFEPSMMCSGAVAGRFDVDYVYSRRDAAGLSFGDELARIGYKGERENRPGSIHAYLEPHIEQGPVLEAEGLPLGVVTGIVGLKWMNVTLTGVQQHAGPSPMRTRHDAMVAAGRVVVAIRDLALEYPDPAVGTVGRLRPSPGIINQIPGRVELSVDLRHADPRGHEEMGARAKSLIERIASEEGVAAEVDAFWTCPPVVFRTEMVDLVERAVRAGGAPYRRIVSSAGHDAQYIHEIAPTAMLFVRTLGGKSHCETEAIDWDDAQLAADAMVRAVLDLAGTAGPGSSR